MQNNQDNQPLASLPSSNIHLLILAQAMGPPSCVPNARHPQKPEAAPPPRPGARTLFSRSGELRIRDTVFPGEGKNGTTPQQGPSPPRAGAQLAALVCGKSSCHLTGTGSLRTPGEGFLGQAATPGPGRVPLLARPIWPSLGGRLAWLPAKKELVSCRRQLKERSEPSGSAPKRPILSSP